MHLELNLKSTVEICYSIMKPRIARILRIFWIWIHAPFLAPQKLQKAPVLIRKIREIRGSPNLEARQNSVFWLKSLTLLGCFALASCSWLGWGKKKTHPEPPVATATLVGRVASIQPDRRFVLVQSYGKWQVATGSILITSGPDARSANLLATGESLDQFAAADLQSGTVEVGDAVLLPPPISKKIPPTTPELPKIQQPTQAIKTP